jgi:hypothetical protein
MIEVRVGEHDVPYLLPLRGRAPEGQAPRVDGDNVVDDHGQHMLPPGGLAVLIDRAGKELNPHISRLSCAGLRAAAVDLVRYTGYPARLVGSQIMDQISNLLGSSDPAYRMGLL